MAGPPTELSAFLARYDEGMRSLTLGLRAIVLQELASCHEYIFEMRSKMCCSMARPNESYPTAFAAFVYFTDTRR